MSEDRGRRGRRVMIGGIVGAAGAAVAAGYAVQHRLAARTRVGPDEFEAEGLTVPDDVTHQVIEVDDGGRIHVLERGRGPALVLLHGFMLSGAVWAHQLRDLAETHRVIAIELRGHGRSVPGSSDFAVAAHGDGSESVDSGAHTGAAQQGAPAIRRMAMDVAQVLDRLEVERAVVVGHSMGGMVALQLAHDLPAGELHRRVSGLVLVSTTAGPFSRLPGYRGAVRLAGPTSARALGLADRVGVRLAPSQDLRWWLTRVALGPDAPPVQVRFVESLHMATPPGTLSDLLPSLAAFDVSRWLGSMDLPVLVLVGSHDHLTPPRHAWRTAGALPHAEVVELPRCGHMPMLERRREFGRLVDEFAAKVG